MGEMVNPNAEDSVVNVVSVRHLMMSEGILSLRGLYHARICNLHHDGIRVVSYRNDKVAVSES
jgi:hypothetical protein